MRTAVRAATAVLALACLAQPSWAANCTMSTGAMVFAPYQPLSIAGHVQSRASESRTAITISCSGTGGGDYAIALATPPGRGMRELEHAAGGPPLAFDLYVDPAYTAPWGDQGSGSVLRGSIPAALPATVTHWVYGRIPAGQRGARAGQFKAVLAMTLTYEP